MPIPSQITDLSQSAGSNFPMGSDSPATLDDTQRAHASFIAQLRDGKGFSTPVVVASSSTTDIGGQNSMFVEISGTVDISSFGASYNGPRFLMFQDTLTLRHNSTSLNIPCGADVKTYAGYTAIAVPNKTMTGWNLYSADDGASKGAVIMGGAVLKSAKALTSSVNIPVGYNGSAVGPLTVPIGLSITVGSGSRFVIT
jgi:hypothetical protein